MRRCLRHARCHLGGCSCSTLCTTSPLGSFTSKLTNLMLLIGQRLLQLLQTTTLFRRHHGYDRCNDRNLWLRFNATNFATHRFFIIDVRCSRTRFTVGFHAADNRERLVKCTRLLIKNTNAQCLIIESIKKEISIDHLVHLANLTRISQRQQPTNILIYSLYRLIRLTTTRSQLLTKTFSLMSCTETVSQQIYHIIFSRTVSKFP